MHFLRQRVGKLIDVLDGLRHPEIHQISGYAYCLSRAKPAPMQPGNAETWLPYAGEEFVGRPGETYFFRVAVQTPSSFSGQCVGIHLDPGMSEGRDDFKPQIQLAVDGRQLQGLDGNHTDVILAERATEGQTFNILLRIFVGDRDLPFRLDSHLFVLDRETEEYYYDLNVPYEASRLLDEDSGEYRTIVECLNNSLNLLDLRRESGAEYRASLARAHENLRKEFYEGKCGDKAEKVNCIGHTHIDVAWLWSLAATRDKAVRSFSTVLNLMEQYPEYLFMSSQPQLYKFVKEDAPALYEEIRQRVAEGRWEPEGGMWVEADCNIASGEALVRQFLHGIRFFKREFGVQCEVLWLPDVFGYSAALPQIMEKCGIKYFMTTKIAWNEYNKLPYDTFLWEGIDGTQTLSHFIPARDYIGPKGVIISGRPDKSYRSKTDHITTYNGALAPSQVKGAWQRYQQKDLNNDVLFAFGYGDGGGGPTIDMLENQRRLAHGLPGIPQTRMQSVKEFFHTLEKDVKDSKHLPAWVGELYLEYHRGTYTSMARNKKWNRRGEFACQNAELFGVMASANVSLPYPAEELDAAWETLLLNQFHDILPGSSIREVYEDSKKQYNALFASTGRMMESSFAAIANAVDASTGSVVVFNPNGANTALVEAPAPAGIEVPVVEVDGESFPAQKTEDGTVIFSAPLPSKGYRTFGIREGGKDGDNRLIAKERLLENEWFRVEFNDKGQFSRIYDKRAKRELLRDGCVGNRIVSYEDRPHNYDAWDINDYYTEKSWEVDSVDAIEVVETGPVRAGLRIARTYLDSTIVQYVYIYRDIPRIDVHNDIDWKEHHILLKTLLPFDIHTREAVFDIQFGNVARPTHANTGWDYARFEVCMHKWLDLSEDGYGVSVLNDCKYGVSVNGTEVGLTMLKSATYPNPDADKERHEFVWSVYPHLDGWREAGTVGQAYALNNRPLAATKTNAGGTLPGTYSLVTCDLDNVVIEAVKFAEDDADAVIVRVFECHNRRGRGVIGFAGELASANECDLLERVTASLPLVKGGFSFDIKPYEIKTFKLSLRR